MSLLRKSQKSTKRDSAEHLENNNSLTQGSELPRNEKRFRGKTRTQDLTKGPIIPSILSFAIPLLFTSVVQQFYSTVDLFFVSNILGIQAAAALGISTLLITCLIGLFTGLSVGANIVVARLFGAGEIDRLSRGIHASIVVGLIAGIVLAIVGLLFAPLYIEAMKTPKSAVADALIYLRVYFIAMLAVALYNMAAGVCRALGDSRTPLLAQTVGGLGNIAANWFALCVLGLGIEGVAFATLLSNGIAAGIVLVSLTKIDRRYALRWSRICLDKAFLVTVLRIGIPVGLQAMVITLSNVVVQHQIDLLGVEAITAFSIYFKVELPIYYAILAIGQATTTFVAQNHGAGNHARVSRGVWICQSLGFVTTAILSMVMLAIGYWAFWVFSQDEIVINLGLAIIAITFPFYVFYSILEVQGDAIRGLGYSVAPAVIIFVGICLLRACLVFVFTWDVVTLESIAITYPLTWAVTAACMVVCRMVIERKHGHRIVPK